MKKCVQCEAEYPDHWLGLCVNTKVVDGKLDTCRGTVGVPTTSVSPSETKRYIGDGVYVGFDGYGLTLTTEDGISVTNRIVLEPEVYASLVDYVRALRALMLFP